MARTHERDARRAIMIDMNDFLIDYAAAKLGKKPGLAAQVQDAAGTDLMGLDTLFNDNGVARRSKYLDVAMGFIRDYADETGVAADQVAPEAQKLAQEAMAYLGSHTKDFDKWEEN